MRMPSLPSRTVTGLLLSGLLLLPFGQHAQAQSQDTGDGSAPSIQSTPLAAPPNTSESKVLGDGATVPGQKEGQDTTQTPPAPEPPPGTGNPGTPASSDWVQKTHADLTLLDKIYGSSHQVTATVGTPFQVRYLTITVLACWARPPSLPPDAAIFVQVTDSRAASGSPPEYRGWIFQAEPGLSGVSDATTDISVTGCS